MSSTQTQQHQYCTGLADCPYHFKEVQDGENCCKCDAKVPAEYLNGVSPDEKWVECSCDAHPGWYCPDHTPGNDCWCDEDCDCCNPQYSDDEEEYPADHPSWTHKWCDGCKSHNTKGEWVGCEDCDK